MNVQTITAKPSPRIAQEFRAAGKKMEKAIQQKMNPAIGKQNHTPRRARIAAGMYEDGVRLHKIQTALYKLADMHDSKNITAMLRVVRKKSDIENFLFHSWEWSDEWYERTFDLNIYSQRMYDNLAGEVAGLIDNTEYEKARRKAELYNKAQELIGQVPGYFPTPLKVVRQMISMVNLNVADADEMLDPTAGGGAILDGVKEAIPTMKTFGVEQHCSLAELCREKGHEVWTGDIFQTPLRQFKFILANPPFEADQDCEHACWYFDNLLAPGGKMAIITSAGAFFHTTQKAEIFQALVRAHGYYEDLPAGSFKESKTGVNTCITYLEKPGSEQGEEE